VIVLHEEKVRRVPLVDDTVKSNDVLMGLCRTSVCDGLVGQREGCVVVVIIVRYIECLYGVLPLGMEPVMGEEDGAVRPCADLASDLEVVDRTRSARLRADLTVVKNYLSTNDLMDWDRMDHTRHSR
jgi:hypothetical protein